MFLINIGICLWSLFTGLFDAIKAEFHSFLESFFD